jgi:hypothetical protein
MRIILVCFVAAMSHAAYAGGQGQLLSSDAGVSLWWCSSAHKVRPGDAVPTVKGESIRISAARNEAEAAQLVIYPHREIGPLQVAAGTLIGPAGATIPAAGVEILRVRYVSTTIATDKTCQVGEWPDPLPPLAGKMVAFEAGRNQPLWVRVKVPNDAPAGTYRGSIALLPAGFQGWSVPLEVQVFDFNLPERMTCVTAFGFSPGNVWRYQNIKTEADKRTVLDKYWANFAAHHISPYNPAPLDRIGVRWPGISPPPSKWADWQGLRIVDNEAHRGSGALLIYDDDPKKNVTVAYKPAIPIPKAGLRLTFWHRTAVPAHRFLVTLNHYDADDRWISGSNNDISLRGDGRWQRFEDVIRSFPPQARFVRLFLRATRWTDDGEELGLVWLDDVSLTDAATGAELVNGGDFDPEARTEPVAPIETLKAQLDFSAWDKAMARAIDQYKFNSFRVDIPGMGGGTFHELYEPRLLAFTESDPEYWPLFHSYCRQLQDHLVSRGWIDKAYVYWFDEPDPDQYAFVKNGFEKLKRACPLIGRMLTEQPEEALAGGPNIYCVISNLYRHADAEARRAHGDRFWWYICTGPKAPYCTLFIDHPGTELRVWLWQTWQRNIEGILVWDTNYWTSSAAYPDPARPQNPYEDPMGWTSGYSTPAGERRPWGNGDGRFIYPPEAAADGNPPQPVLEGPVDSIRWEMLRDGIEDYEYLAMLKRLIAEKRHRLTAVQVREFESLLDVPESITKSLTQFTVDPAPIEARRDEIARAIERLGRL